MSLDMLEAIKSDLSKDTNDRNLRVIILRANGPVFSAGHDLKELVSPSKILVFTLAPKLQLNVWLCLCLHNLFVTKR